MGKMVYNFSGIDQATLKRVTSSVCPEDQDKKTYIPFFTLDKLQVNPQMLEAKQKFGADGVYAYKPIQAYVDNDIMAVAFGTKTDSKKTEYSLLLIQNSSARTKIVKKSRALPPMIALKECASRSQNFDSKLYIGPHIKLFYAYERLAGENEICAEVPFETLNELGGSKKSTELRNLLATANDVGAKNLALYARAYQNPLFVNDKLNFECDCVAIKHYDTRGNFLGQEYSIYMTKRTIKYLTDENGNIRTDENGNKMFYFSNEFVSLFDSAEPIAEKQAKQFVFENVDMEYMEKDTIPYNDFVLEKSKNIGNVVFVDATGQAIENFEELNSQ